MYHHVAHHVHITHHLRACVQTFLSWMYAEKKSIQAGHASGRFTSSALGAPAVVAALSRIDLLCFLLTNPAQLR